MVAAMSFVGLVPATADAAELLVAGPTTGGAGARFDGADQCDDHNQSNQQRLERWTDSATISGSATATYSIPYTRQDGSSYTETGTVSGGVSVTFTAVADAVGFLERATMEGTGAGQAYYGESCSGSAGGSAQSHLEFAIGRATEVQVRASGDAAWIDLYAVDDEGRFLRTVAQVFRSSRTVSLGGGRYGADFNFSGGGGLQYSVSGSASIDVEPTAVDLDFDYAAQERYGLDANNDGIVDQYTTAAQITPANGYAVDLTLESCPTSDPATRIVWSIDGTQLSSGFAPDECSIQTRFPSEGRFPVEVEAFDVGSGARLGARFETVVVQDWLIFSLGDSVASGEGTPDRAGPGATWQDRQCHRSASAGPAVAAQLLERNDPKTSVTFVHLACSGASMTEGMLGPYLGIIPGPQLPPQLTQLGTLKGQREVDAVLISVGANDVRFSTILEDCFKFPGCEQPGALPFSGPDFFNARIGALAARYDSVANGLAVRGVRSDRVHITEYFDPTRDDQLRYCDEVMLEEAVNIPVVGISAAEARWAGTDMLVRLDAEVRAAAARNGWRYVGNIFSAFAPHGYCAQDRWIVQLTESAVQQQDQYGTVHPNEAGHAIVYAPRIRTSLFADLYPSGDIASPRPPAS